MMKMMGKVKELQEKMNEARENLVHIKTTAESGAGMVSVQVNGKKQVEKLEIDPDIIKVEDKEMLQDLIIAALNIALKDIEEKSKAELKRSTEGIIPNIPGMDLGSML